VVLVFFVYLGFKAVYKIGKTLGLDHFTVCL